MSSKDQEQKKGCHHDANTSVCDSHLKRSDPILEIISCCLTHQESIARIAYQQFQMDFKTPFNGTHYQTIYLIGSVR